MPAIFTGPRTLSPKMTISPESGGTSPVTSFINDDLPQPDGPTTAANSPRRDGEARALQREDAARRALVGQRDIADVDADGRVMSALP